jgi:hypothetical protein
VVEHHLAKVGVAGSNPVFRSSHPKGALAQLGERLLCTQKVSGSIPLGSTSNEHAFKGLFLCVILQKVNTKLIIEIFCIFMHFFVQLNQRNLSF